ncbi:MAG TPA: hypothetical protein VM096_07255 [Vicinamibacterales bacterium]|nr:hypothetical protein [Vicinamibacterales bacterium]
MTQSEISGISPLFIVTHVPSSLSFYRDRLRFEITFQGPDPDDIFSGIVRRGGAQILFKSVGVPPVPNYTRDSKQGIARWDAYVDVRILMPWRPNLVGATSSSLSRCVTLMTACEARSR